MRVRRGNGGARDRFLPPGGAVRLPDRDAKHEKEGRGARLRENQVKEVENRRFGGRTGVFGVGEVEDDALTLQMDWTTSNTRRKRLEKIRKAPMEIPTV